MDESLVEYAVEKLGKLGASYAEARFEEAYIESFVMRNGNPDAADSSRVSGMGMRALVDGALSFASVDQLSKENVDLQAARCVRLARASARRAKRKMRLTSENAHIATYSVPQKKRLSGVPQEKKFELLLDVDKSVPKGVNVPSRYLWMQLTELDKVYSNSDGSRIKSKTPLVYLICVPTIIANGKSAQAMIWLGKTGGWEAVLGMDVPGRMKKECSVLHDTLTKGQKTPKGKVDLVVGPEVTGIAAHESCGHPYEADRIWGREAAQAGESFVKPDMLGARIGSDAVSILEDPRVPGSYGYYLYDDEGVKARERVLMKNGRINEFLHNRESAVRFGLKSSNGAARSASYNREPLVRMANTFVKRGDYSFDELVEDVKLGVYINSFNEWNIDDVRFNQKYVGREAYLIKNGELKGTVANPRIEVTTPMFWGAVDAVGKDFYMAVGTCGKGEPAQGVPVGMGGPHMRLRGIRLGGA